MAAKILVSVESWKERFVWGRLQRGYEAAGAAAVGHYAPLKGGLHVRVVLRGIRSRPTVRPQDSQNRHGDRQPPVQRLDHEPGRTPPGRGVHERHGLRQTACE